MSTIIDAQPAGGDVTASSRCVVGYSPPTGLCELDGIASHVSGGRKLKVLHA